MRLVASATAGSRSEPLSAADAAVMRAAVAYDDAQFELTGGPGPFVLLEPVDEGDDPYAIDTEALAPASMVTVLQRADYAVLDEEALLTAGEEAHRRLQPEHPPEDDENATVGYAMSEIAHADGWEALDDAPGLRPLGAVRYLVAPDEHVAITDSFDQVGLGVNLAVNGRILFVVGDVY